MDIVMRLFPNTYTFEIVIDCLVKSLRNQYNKTFYKCNAHFSIVTLCICPLPTKSNIFEHVCLETIRANPHGNKTSIINILMVVIKTEVW
jgi:hypothetical protein